MPCVVSVLEGLAMIEGCGMYSSVFAAGGCCVIIVVKVIAVLEVPTVVLQPMLTMTDIIVFGATRRSCDELD